MPIDHLDTVCKGNYMCAPMRSEPDIKDNEYECSICFAKFLESQGYAEGDVCPECNAGELSFYQSIAKDDEDDYEEYDR